MSPDLALPVALMCGYLVIVIQIVWPDHRCHDATCKKNKRKETP